MRSRAERIADPIRDALRSSDIQLKAICALRV
jgi:hypothetical protein